MTSLLPGRPSPASAYLLCYLESSLAVRFSVGISRFFWLQFFVSLVLFLGVFFVAFCWVLIMNCAYIYHCVVAYTNVNIGQRHWRREEKKAVKNVKNRIVQYVRYIVGFDSRCDNATNHPSNSRQSQSTIEAACYRARVFLD